MNAPVQAGQLALLSKQHTSQLPLAPRGLWTFYALESLTTQCNAFPSAYIFPRQEIRRASRVSGAQNQFSLLQFGLGLASFYSPDPKKYSTSKKTGPKMAQMGPDLPTFCGMGLVLGFRTARKRFAKATRNYPGRMKTSREQETSINLRGVCVQQQKRDNPQLPHRWRRWAAFA